MAYSLLLTVVWVLLLQAGSHSDEEIDHWCLQNGVDQMSGNSAAGMHAMFTVTNNIAMRQGNDYIRWLKKHKQKQKGEVEHEDPIADICGKNAYKCDKTNRYRTADGSCNNLKHPTWGESNIALRRWLKPDYDDGACSPRKTGRDDRKLKSARKISRELFKASTNSTENKDVTHMVMQFGQFLDHDITETAIQRGANGSAITCCKDDAPGINVDCSKRPACFPITIPKGDRTFNRSCMNFVRSVQIPNSECNSDYCEQMNQITAFIDGSQVYGSSKQESDELRTFDGGSLKTSDSRMLLPKNSVKDCVTSEEPNFCFKAGDTRVNEQMGLTSIHTIWMREHNRIATELAGINPHWDDERLFQETRRIVGAMLQHITYKEFLPSVLSKTYIEQHKLSPTADGSCSKLYDKNVDPGIHNAFATAAYRFGHSMIRTNFSLGDMNFRCRESLKLTKSFGITELIISSNGAIIGNLTRGLVKDHALAVNRFFSKEVNDFLFKDKLGNSMDLMALNIQRGRDHGLPSYNAWREFCGLTKASNFKGLVNHPEDVVVALKALYGNVDDIDLFPGGVTEVPVPGGLLGPTFSCLVARQFEALKIGDRFWYETCHGAMRFKPGQLRQLHNTSLAKVICRNTDTIKIQPSVFKTADDASNSVRPCLEIPSLNLDEWKDKGEWSTWTKWSQCHRTRTRTCSKPGKCRGPSVWKRPCRMCMWDKWSKWGKCVEGCQSKTRTCPCKSCGGGDKEGRRWRTCGKGNKGGRKSCGK